MLVFCFCAFMAFVYMPFDFLLKPLWQDVAQAEEVWFGVMLQVAPGGDKKQTAEFQKGYANNLLVGFKEDIQIWEHKIYVEKPILAEGDGPIAEYRRYCKQFYRQQQAVTAKLPVVAA